MEEKTKTPHKSLMTRGETIAALVYLPVHIALLPSLLYMLMQGGYLSETQVNFLCYAIGVAYMLLFTFRFLRRDFDPICDRPGYCFLQIAICYGLMMAFNLCVSAVLLLFTQEANPNNSALLGMADINYGSVTAMAVFMAPIVEEVLFRGAIFGLARRYNRVLAYALSMLAFSLYHVWAYAIADPSYWIYIIQYLPVSYLLCRCYERTESIWCSIFFHMLVNAISLRALMMLEELL